MNELERARPKSEYLEYVNQLAGLELLIIDDFGLMEMDLDKCRDLFEVIDSRESRKSTMFVSQFPVKEWYELFVDSTYADACLDRIVLKAYRLELSGRNMRNPNSQSRLMPIGRWHFTQIEAKCHAVPAWRLHR